MNFIGIKLKDYKSSCSYLENKLSTIENVLIPSYDNKTLIQLLENGYRHFGNYFFRPICKHCRQCIPIRVVLENFSFPKSARRLFKRNARFKVRLQRPNPSREAYFLYLRHQNRFEKKSSQTVEDFVQSFCYPASSSFQLSVFDGNTLIAVSHLDITASMTSAVYSYYDERYRTESLGTFLIYKAIENALQLGQHFIYLGYYVPDNRHMKYKARFRPNQLLVKEGRWVDYVDPAGVIRSRHVIRTGFTPVTRLDGDNIFQ